MSNPVIDGFFATEEGRLLYKESCALFDKIENENAHRVSVNGIEMAYLDFGPSDAIPLIWAHGSASTSYEITNAQVGLVEAGYRVIAIDYRGHGKTQLKAMNNNTSLYHIADDIAALMDSLGIEKAVLGGLSKGGWTAAAFYDAYPHRTLGLVLEDGGSFSSLRWKDDIQLGVVTPGIVPYTIDIYERVLDTSIVYPTRLDGVKAKLESDGQCFSRALTPEFIVHLMAMFISPREGQWVFHCDIWELMAGELINGPEDNDHTATQYYSRLALMQQSQELMMPSVIFRNLSLPVHIIDPVSKDHPLYVRHQNVELQAQHPDWIVHEVYEYDFSPHEAHFERPERFVKSASALLARVTASSNKDTGNG